MLDLLISLIILVIVAGFAVWIVTLLPIPEPFKSIAMALVALVILLILLGRLLPLAHAANIGHAEVMGGKVTRIPTTWSAEPQDIRPSNPGEYAENRAKQVWQQKRWLGEVTMGGHTYRLIEPKENACLVAAHALADALRVEDWNCRSVVRS